MKAESTGDLALLFEAKSFKIDFNMLLKIYLGSFKMPAEADLKKLEDKGVITPEEGSFLLGIVRSAWAKDIGDDEYFAPVPKITQENRLSVKSLVVSRRKLLASFHSIARDGIESFLEIANNHKEDPYFNFYGLQGDMIWSFAVIQELDFLREGFLRRIIILSKFCYISCKGFDLSPFKGDTFNIDDYLDGLLSKNTLSSLNVIAPIIIKALKPDELFKISITPYKGMNESEVYRHELIKKIFQIYFDRNFRINGAIQVDKVLALMGGIVHKDGRLSISEFQSTILYYIKQIVSIEEFLHITQEHYFPMFTWTLGEKDYEECLKIYDLCKSKGNPENCIDNFIHFAPHCYHAMWPLFSEWPAYGTEEYRIKWFIAFVKHDRKTNPSIFVSPNLAKATLAEVKTLIRDYIACGFEATEEEKEVLMSWGCSKGLAVAEELDLYKEIEDVEKDQFKKKFINIAMNDSNFPKYCAKICEEGETGSELFQKKVKERQLTLHFWYSNDKDFAKIFPRTKEGLQDLLYYIQGKLTPFEFKKFLNCAKNGKSLLDMCNKLVQNPVMPLVTKVAEVIKDQEMKCFIPGMPEVNTQADVKLFSDIASILKDYDERYNWHPMIPSLVYLITGAVVEKGIRMFDSKIDANLSILWGLLRVCVYGNAAINFSYDLSKNWIVEDSTYLQCSLQYIQKCFKHPSQGESNTKTPQSTLLVPQL